MLGRVPGRVLHRQDGLADCELVAILELLVFEAVTSIRLMTEIDFGGTDAGAQLSGAADQIRVDVCLKNVSDRNAL